METLRKLTHKYRCISREMIFKMVIKEMRVVTAAVANHGEIFHMARVIKVTMKKHLRKSLIYKSRYI